MQVFGVDVGGSGVKGAPVDLTTGKLVGERTRIPTPKPSTPDAVTDAIVEIVGDTRLVGTDRCNGPERRHQRRRRDRGKHRPGMGRAATSPTCSPERLGTPVTVLNDADAAGLAEVTYGAAKGEQGVVILLTFGTGIGSAYLHRGQLIPNTELGHLIFKGQKAEHYAAGRLVKRGDLEIDWWAQRVDELLDYLDDLFWPDLFVFGGGISKRFETYSHFFTTRAPIVPAVLRNQAGIVGAALAASRGVDHG